MRPFLLMTAVLFAASPKAGFRQGVRGHGSTVEGLSPAACKELPPLAPSVGSVAPRVLNASVLQPPPSATGMLLARCWIDQMGHLLRCRLLEPVTGFHHEADELQRLRFSRGWLCVRPHGDQWHIAQPVKGAVSLRIDIHRGKIDSMEVGFWPGEDASCPLFPLCGTE